MLLIVFYQQSFQWDPDETCAVHLHVNKPTNHVELGALLVVNHFITVTECDSPVHTNSFVVSCAIHGTISIIKRLQTFANYRYTRNMNILHLAPHPDDEALGCPALLLAAKDAGHAITNWAVSLGRPADHERRTEELMECARRMQWSARITRPHDISSNHDLVLAQQKIETDLRQLIIEIQPDVIISPQVHDAHHGHEVVARASRNVLLQDSKAGLSVPIWWMWGLWRGLPYTTLMHSYDEAMMKRIQYGLAAYAGETERNDYTRLLTGRAMSLAITSPERIWGFGSQGVDASYADAVCEVIVRDGRFFLAQGRHFTEKQKSSDKDITDFLSSAPY